VNQAVNAAADAAKAAGTYVFEEELGRVAILGGLLGRDVAALRGGGLEQAVPALPLGRSW
jgi:hypothetical protein